ncbi:spore germination protein GerW family protein [Nonomuraea fuscirosea]|uniref:spore germination protein GerW family protein n=1 Tax=Nonomuraea fuscirosea TaxID=1291556 RepID=UPI0033C2FCDC
MDGIDVSGTVKEVARVERVFGEPILRNGVTVIPVARIGGGGGSGSGKQEGERPGEGNGGGFGLGAAPAGVFVIKDEDVRWRPAVDINKIIIGGQVVAVVALLTARAIVRARSATCAHKRR